MSSIQEAHPPTANQILNALTRAEYEHLIPYLEPVKLSLGDVLCHPDEPINHVYFPNRGTVSIVAVFEDGGTVEVGMVGNEGMFGIGVFLGGVTAPFDAIVQLPGDGFRMRADVIDREFKGGGHLHDLLLCYTQAFIIQVAQTAACNRAHPIRGRMARWLLMCQDRAHSKELKLTHEFIATMLGTRRAGVTTTAGQLQDEGVIVYRRGHVTVTDREGLEAISCECYRIVKKEFDRLLGVNGHAL